MSNFVWTLANLDFHWKTVILNQRSIKLSEILISVELLISVLHLSCDYW